MIKISSLLNPVEEDEVEKIEVVSTLEPEIKYYLLEKLAIASLNELTYEENKKKRIQEINKGESQ